MRTLGLRPARLAALWAHAFDPMHPDRLSGHRSVDWSHRHASAVVDDGKRAIEALVDLMHRATMIYGRRGLAMFAISGVEIALWDLLGKLRGAPVYELLGGAVRPRLPVYASLLRYDSPAAVAEACRHFVSQGFRMLKLHQTDVASVRAAREAVGPEVELMLDTNCPWTPLEAVAMARALAPYRLFWLEEPVWPPEDYAGLARVAADTETPIALGENESTLFGFREIVRQRAGDILQPLAAGVIGKEAVLGDLSELCRGTVRGRTSAEEITLFKSVGVAVEDVAAAALVLQQRAG